MSVQMHCSNFHGIGTQAKRGLTGIMNYTNPGCISHNEIMELYKQYIDPEFKWQNFTIEEQAKVIVAPRSNNLLDTKRVRAACAFALVHLRSPMVARTWHFSIVRPAPAASIHGDELLLQASGLVQDDMKHLHCIPSRLYGLEAMIA